MNKKGFVSQDPYSTLAVLPNREPDTYDQLGAIADKLISQGYPESYAFEAAAKRCEAKDFDYLTEALQWE